MSTDIERALITGVTDRPSTDAVYVEVLEIDDVTGRATVKTYNDTIVSANVAPGLILSVGTIAVMIIPWGANTLGQIIQGATNNRPVTADHLVIPLDEG